MPLTFKQTDIEGVQRVETEVFEDERGMLCEVYRRDAFHEAGIDNEFKLELVSSSEKNVLRGLHYQTEPYRQAKLVRCVSGAIFDVAVDIRSESDSFGEYVSARLTGKDHSAIFIPRGFAHGFVSLAKDSRVYYKIDNEYRPEHEAGICWNDPFVDVDWPVSDPNVSVDDRSHPTLRESDNIKRGDIS